MGRGSQSSPRGPLRVSDLPRGKEIAQSSGRSSREGAPRLGVLP